MDALVYDSALSQIVNDRPDRQTVLIGTGPTHPPTLFQASSASASPTHSDLRFIGVTLHRLITNVEEYRTERLTR